MKIRPIHTTNDYKVALREASADFDTVPEPGATEAGRRRDGQPLTCAVPECSLTPA